MARNVAQVAHWVVWALTGHMAWLAAVVADLDIGTICSYMTWFVAVIADSALT